MPRMISTLRRPSQPSTAGLRFLVIASSVSLNCLAWPWCPIAVGSLRAAAAALPL